MEDKEKVDKSTEKPRILARVLAEDLEIVNGGACTSVITDGATRDITNRDWDNDGCSV